MQTLTYHGHACFVLEGAGKRLIIDPFLTGNPTADIGVDGLPKVDAILVSHGHDDHLGDAIAIAKRDRATIVATYELAAFCEQQGATVHKMNVGGAHQFPFGKIKLVPALHTGTVDGDDGTHTATPCGFLVTLGGTTVYHTGDTGLTMEMQLLQGRVDVMLLPIGDNYTMGIEDAVRALGLVQPHMAIPMHYNTFDTIKADPEEFKRKVGNKSGVDVVVLAPGQSLKHS